MKYERVVQYVLETPWAIRPLALGAILDILAYRADGHTFTDEEMAERIGGAQAAQRKPQRAGSTAVLPLYGPIFPRANLLTEMSGGTSLQKWSAQFKAMDADSKISNIVLDVASPGGSVELVPETAEVIRSASTPVTAVANTQAASAAYWLAAQADEIVVTPSGEVGSIGVWTAHDDFSRHDRNLGVETTLISAGKYKTEANPWEPLGEEARAALQKAVDEFYGMFVDDVAKGRGTSTAKVIGGYGEGRMVLARDSVREGMADRVATLDQVISDLASNGGGTKAVLLGDDPAQVELWVTRHSDPDDTTATDDAAATPPEPDPQPEEGMTVVAVDETHSFDLGPPWARKLVKSASARPSRAANQEKEETE